MRFSDGVMVVQARCLRTGDLIAREFLGGVISGRITSLATYKYQLTDEQIAYLRELSIDIPDGQWAPITSPGEILLFGDFEGNNDSKHMFMPGTNLVAVFHFCED